MKIILADTNKEVTDAFEQSFNQVSNVEVYYGSMFDIPNKTPCDAFISPANSWGFMDGGLDLALSQYFGWHVQERIQTKIKNEYNGELLVGQALVVPTDHEQVPYCICAPTMRLPTILRSSDGNAYLAMKAILLLLNIADKKGYPMNTIVIPGLGTGVGQLSPKDCADQMYWAYHTINSMTCCPTTDFPTSLYNARKMYGF